MTGRGSRGFTLLEVLVALGILMLGSSCVIALFSAALETFRRSELEFTATSLALETLDTAEDAVASGAPLDTLAAEVKRRAAAAPAAFTVDLTQEERAGAVVLTCRVAREGQGKIRSWTWKRAVIPADGNRRTELPERAPERYRGGTQATGR